MAGFRLHVTVALNPHRIASDTVQQTAIDLEARQHLPASVVHMIAMRTQSRAIQFSDSDVRAGNLTLVFKHHHGSFGAVDMRGGRGISDQ